MEQPFKLTLRVTWWMQIIQILFGLFFTIATLLSIVRSPAIPVINTVLLFSVAYLGWANAFSTIQIDEKRLTVNVFYGRFRINWDEVDLILVKNPMIALINSRSGKRLVISLAFGGKNSKELLQFLNQKIAQRSIRVEENAGFPITHHKARVWR